jgi:GST-like protein
MIDLYYWTTPNGHKITIYLEETGLAHRVIPVNISAGEQFAPAFLAISPNNRIPAIVDHAPADGGAPFSLMESGAILQYLAEKTGRLLPEGPARPLGMPAVAVLADGRARSDGGPEPPLHLYSIEKIPYAIDRYVARNRAALSRCSTNGLADRAFIAGDYSIADIACYPWVQPERRSRTSPRFRISRAGSRRSPRGRRCSAPMRWRRRST